MLTGRVITVSDRCAAGTAIDRCGPLAVDLLRAHGAEVDFPRLAPDDPDRIADLVRLAVAEQIDVVVLTGGTGIGPKDVTPEALTCLLDRLVPGVAEAIRANARRTVPAADLARIVAGAVGNTFVLALPGSIDGVRDGIAVAGPLLGHARLMLRGEGHVQGRDAGQEAGQDARQEARQDTGHDTGQEAQQDTAHETGQVARQDVSHHNEQEGGQPATVSAGPPRIPPTHSPSTHIPPTRVPPSRIPPTRAPMTQRPGAQPATTPALVTPLNSKGTATNGAVPQGAAPEGAASQTLKVALCEITDQELDRSACESLVGGPGSGAVVSFAGVVRDHDRGRNVTHLEYQAHPSARRTLFQLVNQVVTQNPELSRVAVIQRVGQLAVGEPALIVAVAAAHRTAAFSACSQLVDEIKHGLPIWKRQVFADGSDEWVNCA